MITALAGGQRLPLAAAAVVGPLASCIRRWISSATTLGLWVALLAAGGCAAGSLAQGPHPPSAAYLIAIPDVRQSYDYSCGAAALQSVLAFYGESLSEEEAIALLGTSEEFGTTPESIVRVATELGLRAEIAEHLTVDDLRSVLGEGVPVIVAIQAWVEERPAGFSWAGCWEEGHYEVVIGLDERYVYLEDPSLFGTRGRIPVNEFVERWHDYSREASLDPGDRLWVRLGIIIRDGGTVGRRLPPFTDVE